MKQALNKFITSKRKFEAGSEVESEMLADEERKFCAACKTIVDQLGEKPFHLRGRLNYAVLDSVFSAVFNAVHPVENLGERYQRLTENAKFIEHVTKNTSDELALKERFELAIAEIVS